MVKSMPELTFLGHSCFLLKHEDTTCIFDPFITGNPLSTLKLTDIKPTVIFLTHAHGDHLGDTIPLAKSSKALVVTTNDLGLYLEKKGLNVHRMHIGGTHKFDWGKVKITIAHHGSSLVEDGKVIMMGDPCGMLVTLGGKTVYHAGDTGLFLDMQLIGELTPIDVALLPIGDNYTMGVKDAVKAVEFLKPKNAIPMHFSTFPIIENNPKQFLDGVKNQGINALLLKPGESFSF
jgi:L-ascorbate metabolism protein UlaG (beta-lactamase superfamily)